MTQQQQPKLVESMSIDELEREHRQLRKRIDARRERIMQKPFSKIKAKKLLALCNELYGMQKIP